MKKTNFKNLLLALFATLFMVSCENSSTTENLDEAVQSLKISEQRNQTSIPGNIHGIKIISCMEVNDVNPLNNISYTLKKTGQPLFDMVILFSSNINYNTTLGRPFIHHNTEMTNILNNTNKYIKPLKDKGIKIILSLLGNWDRAGVANMSKETAEQFAQEIKKTLDLYDLDGVMFDDEYSSYITPPPAGFVTPSSAAAGRLMYETKKAIGNKMVLAYIYNRLQGQMPTIDNMTPANYVDYALSDYFAAPVSSNYYTGMSNKQKAPWSQEFNLGRVFSAYGGLFSNTYQYIIDQGYGAHLIFGLNPNSRNFNYIQLPELKAMGKAFCEDEVIYDGQVYPTDYK